MKITDLASAGGVGLDYQKVAFDYVRHADQAAKTPAKHPVVIVGAGPVGLALAIDLAQQQVPVVLLDNDDRLSTGSRAICFSKRSLEVFDRLGCGERMARKGVSWKLGRVFFQGEQVYEFDLLPEDGHDERPAFVNLQQYYVEGFLAERAAQLPLIDIRWRNKVTGVEQHDDHALLTIDTPDGSYRLAADYAAACDGSRSSVRELIGQESKGRVFKDRFLIADVKMTLDRPAERWFWFDPEFHRNQSVLLHMQPDNVWRIDFQLGWDADPEEEKKPEKIIPRVQALLADSPAKDAQFELEWASVYTFACARMARFRHGRVLFAGDSAHGVSPFGARGANSGVQDAENLAWKLAAVVRGKAPDALLDSYAAEREFAADENIRHSSRATDFITPKSDVSRLYRDAVLTLSKQHAFARKLVNSGRLSVPATLHGSALNTVDAKAGSDAGNGPNTEANDTHGIQVSDAFAGAMVPGAVAADAPIVLAGGRKRWLLRELGHSAFTALVFGDDAAAERSVRAVIDADPTVRLLRLRLNEDNAIAAKRYDAKPGTTYLLRPDQHVCARWRAPDAAAIRGAVGRALGKSAMPA